MLKNLLILKDLSLNLKKEKKSSNIKIDKLLEDEKTATDSKLKSSAKGDKSDDYASKIYEILQAGAPISQDTKSFSKSNNNG